MEGGERELAAQLLERAPDDAAAASALLEVAGVSDAIVGFHAQQAVEKAIKAVLTSRRIDYPFTHDLELLAALADRAGTPLPVGLDDVPRLTPYAASLRYGEIAPGIVDRPTALRWAQSAVVWAREVTSLPGD
jgi:HEPN domain-containing protein